MDCKYLLQYQYPPSPSKQPITKKPIKLADSLGRTRRQKEDKGEPLLKGTDKTGKAAARFKGASKAYILQVCNDSHLPVVQAGNLGIFLEVSAEPRRATLSAG